MASACVNNTIGDKSFLPWDPEPADFEFRLQDPVAMLPADQLFSDGKLVPLHLKPTSSSSAAAAIFTTAAATTSVADCSLFSPKAPRCSSRWKDLLGLKKLYHSTNNSSSAAAKSSPSPSKSLKHFLHRPKSENHASSSSLSLPLLKDSDCESLSISSSRLSLSSSSSGHDHDDLPRLSLDSEKPNNPNQNPNPISIHRSTTTNNNPRVRLVKARTGSGSFDGNKPEQQQQNPGNRAGRSPIRMEQQSGTGGCRGVSVDSPRMNSSGKIVFQSLERSSSSPGSFTGGPRFKHRGMERSYSANVRVTPVLNVPVCSLRGGSKSGSVFGFGQLFSSPQKKDGSGSGSTTATNKSHHHHHQQLHSVRHRSDRN